jgi:hypothetical protein
VDFTLFLEWSIVLLFGCWSLLSLLLQVPKLNRRIRQYDIFLLIPEWKFFAPQPGQHDFSLLYRDIDREENYSAWKEIQISPERRWWNCIWNPMKRGQKAIFDFVVELSGLNRMQEETILFSNAYISLLMIVTREKRLLQNVRTQFIILRKYTQQEENEPEVLYLSRLHDIE